MAPRRERAGAARTPGEKHGWLRFDSYQEIHQRTLERAPAVIDDGTVFTRVAEDGTPLITLDGDVTCEGGIVIEVSKVYDVRERRGQEEIRGVLYRYTARVPGRGNILRYDNLHLETPDEYHRHEYDLTTWEQTGRTVLSREEMPTLAEVVQEVMRIAAAGGLLDSS